MTDVKALDSDPEAIKAIFGETSFSLTNWLNSLTPEGLAEYATIVEKNRTTAAHISGIVDKVVQFASVKAWFIVLFVVMLLIF